MNETGVCWVGRREEASFYTLTMTIFLQTIVNVEDFNVIVSVIVIPQGDETVFVVGNFV